MKYKKLFRHYHSFYTPKNSLCKNIQEQSYLEKGIIHTRPPLNNAPDFKIKTGLERFIERYGESWREMFIGSKK